MAKVYSINAFLTLWMITCQVLNSFHLKSRFSISYQKFAETIAEDDRDLLLVELSKLLPTWAYDPTPLTDLTTSLIKPSAFSFDKLCTLRPLQTFAQGLSVPNVSINSLTLSFLAKASYSLSDIAKVVSDRELVQAWVNLWLCSPVTSVSQEAFDVLKSFLATEGPVETPGVYDLTIRRLFQDEGIYRSFFDTCDSGLTSNGSRLSRSEITIAQGRLLEFVIDVDGPSSPVRASQIPTVEESFGVHDGGLLAFAFCQMHIDPDDPLMLSVYLQACTRYMERRSKAGSDQSDWPLRFLKDNGIHQRCLNYYLKPDNSFSWLVSDSALYLGMYSISWPDDLIGDRDLSAQVLHLLAVPLRNASVSQWRTDDTLNSHLSVLGRLPRVLHIDDAAHYTGVSPPLLDVPNGVTNENITSTLTNIFCMAKGTREQAASRVSYFLYLRAHPSLWSSIARDADAKVLSGASLAAIGLMDSFLSANWAPLPTAEDLNEPIRLPTESELAAKITNDASLPLPKTGWEALFNNETARLHVIPYLLKPPEASSMGAISRNDIENIAWKIASAKFDLIVKAHKKLQEISYNDAFFASLAAELATRIALGPTEGYSSIGGQIGTQGR